jgi:hypothetical protein
MYRPEEAGQRKVPMSVTKRTNGKAAGSIELLELDVLAWGGTCQLRAEIDEEHVQRLAEALDRDQASVPAIAVLYDSRQWRIACPKKACPTLGAAVLEQVADEWLNGGWFR